MTDLSNVSPNQTDKDAVILWNRSNKSVLDGDISAYQPSWWPHLWWIIVAGGLLVAIAKVNLTATPGKAEQDALASFNIWLIVALSLTIVIGSPYTALWWWNLVQVRHHGIVIKAKLTSCTVTKRNAKRGYYYHVHFSYEFDVPDRHHIRDESDDHLTQTAMDLKPSLNAGDQVAVLYLDDNHFALL